VLYHFTVYNAPEGVHEQRSRPAMVTSIGASDDVVNLFVFFEPEDLRDNPFASNQGFVRPFNPSNPTVPGWSWPPRS
jgi:hypothetical protein